MLLYAFMSLSTFMFVLWFSYHINNLGVSIFLNGFIIQNNRSWRIERLIIWIRCHTFFFWVHWTIKLVLLNRYWFFQFFLRFLFLYAWSLFVFLIDYRFNINRLDANYIFLGGLWLDQHWLWRHYIFLINTYCFLLFESLIRG